jgi:predicted HicB family RNase H-like nuclease
MTGKYLKKLSYYRINCRMHQGIKSYKGVRGQFRVRLDPLASPRISGD